MSQTMRITSPEALAGALPTWLGFTPRESVVLVGLAASGKVAMLVRLDLAEAADETKRDDLARDIARPLINAEAHRCITVVYTNRTINDTRTIVERFTDSVDRTDIANAWHVSHGMITAYDGDDQPRPIEAPPSGAVTTPSTINLAGEAITDPTDAYAAWLATVENPATLTDETLNTILTAMTSVVFRDAALLSLLPDSRDVAAAVLKDPKAPGVAEALSQMIAGTDAPGPEQDDHLALLARLTSAATDHRAAAPAAIAAMLLWWKGENGRAYAQVQKAMNAQPGYRLAELVAAAVNANMPPGWLAAAQAA